MTVHLLDINILIALVDPAHVQHEVAHDWFGRVGSSAFATCPLTENGLLRILGHPKYPNSPGPPSIVARTLVAIRQMGGHHFWPDTISLVDDAYFNLDGLSSHSRVTDSYLLGLACANGGVLATMDGRLAADAVSNGSGSLVFIGA